MKRALFVLAGPSILALAATAGAQTPAAAPDNAPTFTRDIAPILNKSCVSCHRPGEIGPMSFLTYESTRPWAPNSTCIVRSRKRCWPVPMR